MSFSDDDHTVITDLQGNLITRFPAEHPNHDDMTGDANGNETAVGKAVSSPYGGMIVKVRLKEDALTKLTTGGYVRPFFYAGHDLQNRCRLFVDTAPYKGEIAS